MFLFRLMLPDALRLLLALNRKRRQRAPAATLRPKNASPQTVNADDWDDDYDNAGRSPNDDRSDSMNPNNDAYQSAMDNHANQMNPNNAAYHSSRGGR